MKLVINGEDRTVEGPLTLSRLVEQLGKRAVRLAVDRAPVEGVEGEGEQDVS